MIPVLRKKLDRVLLKLSGEALAGEQGQGIDPSAARYIAEEVVAVHKAGVQAAVVVGGGNFVRGRILHESGGMDQAVADSMGMLGTIINGVALQEAIERLGVPSRLMSAINVQAVCEPFIRRRALRHLEKGRIVILAAGTGNPFFTTDTAGVLRALEIGAQAVVKATRVDGVYDKDPRKHDDASRYDAVSFEEAINKQLAVMDQTAFTLCREHSLPIIVLSLSEAGAMKRAVMGETIGTWVGGES
jgi:uridylate kinase